jgi:anti-sigma B factor antagonist
MFAFDKKEQEGAVVLKLTGGLDAMTAATFKPEVVAIADSKALKVVVDLAPLTLIDSTGVGVLISLFKRTRAQGGHVYFAGLSGQPREVFRLLRLDKSLDMFSSVGEAIDKITKA